MTDSSNRGGLSKVSLAAKLAIVVAALSGAAWFTFRGNPDAEQIDTPESAALYICLADRHVFELTPAGFERLLKSGGLQTVAADDGSRGGRRLRCPKCGRFEAVSAARCPQHPDVVLPVSCAQTRPSACPKCGWVPD